MSLAEICRFNFNTQIMYSYKCTLKTYIILSANVIPINLIFTKTGREKMSSMEKMGEWQLRFFCLAFIVSWPILNT